MSGDDQPKEPALQSVALEEKREGNKAGQQNGRVEENALIWAEEKAVQPQPQRRRESLSFVSFLSPDAISMLTPPSTTWGF